MPELKMEELDAIWDKIKHKMDNYVRNEQLNIDKPIAKP